MLRLHKILLIILQGNSFQQPEELFTQPFWQRAQD